MIKLPAGESEFYNVKWTCGHRGDGYGPSEAITGCPECGCKTFYELLFGRRYISTTTYLSGDIGFLSVRGGDETLNQK